MTEYEMAYLFNEWKIANATQPSIMVTIVFAFLVSSYFAAHRLSVGMVAVGIGMFMLWALLDVAQGVAAAQVVTVHI